MAGTDKRVNILINFLSKGMAETIAHTKQVQKALGRTKSLRAYQKFQDIGRTKTSALNSEIKNMGNTYKKLSSPMKQLSSRGKEVMESLSAPRSITEAIDATKFSDMNTQLKALGNVSDKIRIPMKQLSVAGLGWNKVMGMSLGTLKQVNEQGLQKGFTRLGKFAFGIRRATHGMRGFRMELLGVMFFGMGVQKFFKGLLTPAMKMVGVFDILNATLGIVFLPIVLTLLDPLLKLSTFLINLSDKTKMFLGWIAVGGVILGGFLFLFGMFGLGIGSLILAFSSLFRLFGDIGAGLGGFLGGLLDMIPGVDGASDALGGLGKFAGILIPLIGTGSLIGKGIAWLVSKFKEFWQTIKGTGAWAELTGGFGKLGGMFGTIKDSIDEAFGGIQGKMGNFVDDFLKKWVKKLGGKIEEGETPFKAFKRVILEQIEEIKKAFTGEATEEEGGIVGTIQDMATSFGDLWEKVKDIDFTKMADSFVKLAASLIDLLPDLAELVELALKLAGLPDKILRFLGVGEPSLAQEYGAKRVIEATTDPDKSIVQEWQLTGLGWVIKEAIIEGFNIIKGAGGTLSPEDATVLS